MSDDGSITEATAYCCSTAADRMTISAAGRGVTEAGVCDRMTARKRVTVV
jgi:hypothetical protein